MKVFAITTSLPPISTVRFPKNPQIADFLIGEALERRGVSADSGLEKIDDTLANKAREVALKLSR